MGLLNGNLTGLGLLDRNTVGQIATGEFLGNARNVGDAEQRMAAQNYNDAVNSGVTGSALQSLQTTMGQAAQKNSYTQRGVDMVSTLNPTNAGFQRANGELVSAPTTREFGAWGTVPSMALNTFGGQNFGAAASFNPDSNNRSVNFSPTAMRETAESAYRTGPGIFDFDQEAIGRAFNDTYAHEFTHAGSDLTDKFGERSAKADHGFMDSVAKGMKADTLSDPRSRDLTGFNVEAAPAQTLEGLLGQLSPQQMQQAYDNIFGGFRGQSVTDPSQVANQVGRQQAQNMFNQRANQRNVQNEQGIAQRQAAAAQAAAAQAAAAARQAAVAASHRGSGIGGYSTNINDYGSYQGDGGWSGGYNDNDTSYSEGWD
tara:strand:+ start:3323 stop:4435 length:1113 start_codon:yes stop_codon:yes gene_type:complete